MIILMRKKDYSLNYYKCGYYEVTLCNKNIGRTLFFTKSKSKAIAFFNSLD